MSIKTTCSCGAEFSVKPELAGKRVKCPKCGETLTIPKPQPAESRIRVNCQCGKTLQAKADFAGKQVKCPACGQPLLIPDPRTQPDTRVSSDSRHDPLGLDATGDDPLGLGEFRDDPVEDARGTLPAASTPSAQVPRAKSTGRRKRRAGDLLTAAGWVAVCFGGYQTLICAASLAQSLFHVVRSGSPTHLISIGPVFTVLLLALGIWLGKSGLDIVRDISPRESLERAAQASMVYIALFILQLIMSVIVAVRTPAFALLALMGHIARVIYIFPPAFILFVDRRLSEDTDPGR